MAYDEHWSTSAPGPVASLEWCRNVATYAAETIPAEKLIMGLPFYGRAWSNDDTAGAYRFSSIDRLYRGENSKGKLSEDTKITPVTLENGIPTFKLSKNVTYIFYLDNALSLSKRLEIYNELGITSVGFWRLGQEDSDIWKLIRVKQ
jgi:spore germination protein YaaH